MIDLINIFNTNKNTVDGVQTVLKHLLSEVKDELEDHREAINENTNEVQSNYEHILRVENKIDKMQERIEEMTLMVAKLSGQEIKQPKKYEIKKLTIREKEIFVALYTTEKPTTYKEIARRTALNESLVMTYAVNMIGKGVPIVKRYVNNQVLLCLEKEFKQVQTKENIIELTEEISAIVNV